MDLGGIQIIILIGKMDTWNGIYRRKGVVQSKVSNQIISLVSILQKEKVKIILDHGCGTGRHVKYLTEQGFYVVGTDYSEESIKIARENLGESYFSQLIVSDMEVIPLRDDYFDAVVSSHVIQHALKDVRDKTFRELERVLRKEGLLFLRTISKKQFGFGLGERVEEDTYINIPELPDGETPHHYFSEEELKKYLRNFKILSLTHKSSPASGDFWDNGLEEWVLLARKN